MQGKRIYQNQEGYIDPQYLHEPGCYFKWDKYWYGVAPNGLLCGLGKHQVVEHEDGTIAVSPSILVSNGKEQWHGFLENGTWREV